MFSSESWLTMLLVGDSGVVLLRVENRRFLTKSRSLLTPLSVVQMLSLGDSLPEDDAGLAVVGVFDVGGGVAESNDKSSKSSSSEKYSRLMICLAGFTFLLLLVFELWWLWLMLLLL